MSCATLGSAEQGTVILQGAEPWLEVSLIRAKFKPVTVTEKEIKSGLSRTVVEVFALQDEV